MSCEPNGIWNGKHFNITTSSYTYWGLQQVQTLDHSGGQAGKWTGPTTLEQHGPASYVYVSALQQPIRIHHFQLNIHKGMQYKKDHSFNKKD